MSSNHAQSAPERMTGGNKKLTKSKSGLRVIPINNTERSPFELKEPAWSPDKENLECSNSTCGVRFDLLKRRHHCRRCGQIFCGSCCRTRSPLPRMCFVDPVRQCTKCSDVTVAENAFFNSNLKLLIQGAPFDVSAEEAVPGALCQVALSTDHRLLRFEPTTAGAAAPEQTVEVARIQATQVQLSDILYAPGQLLPEAVAVTYRSPGSVEERSLRLTAGPHLADWRHSAAWITALEQAMQLVYEGREPSQF